jgi:glycosyltransferase involved in cell wall biosynthesis
MSAGRRRLTVASDPISVYCALEHDPRVSPRRPLVSVVLPTFNRAHLIEAAVRNVLAQDYPNLELIVVNDGSRDATAELLGRLERELADPRLRVIAKENGGLPRALNSGFEEARGEYLTWTSDDNAYRPGAISAMVRELELHPEASLVFADWQLIGADGKRGKVMQTGPVEELAWRNIVGACFLYRAEAAREVGAYDPGVELAEDYDYWLRLARVGKLVRLPRVLYDYSAGPDRLSWRRAVEAGQAAARVIERHGSQRALHDLLVSLACGYKWHGFALASFTTAMRLIARFPLSRAAYWAAARAMTPLVLLRVKRKLRGPSGLT